MTVYENIAFSLRNRHMDKDEINKRVLEAAKVLGIEDYLQRKPKAMSGGQRQRVALGRAIVRNPKVFLLDEPLSNLDAKLRAQMRTEISKLHKKLATTFIYVTHDQVEAMTMGTRIVVMKLGFVQQIDTPTNLYNHPINKFVAGFIGTPQMNFFDVTLKREGAKVKIVFDDKQEAEVDAEYFIKCDPAYLDGNTHVTLGIRPDNILIKDGKKGLGLLVTSIEKLGNETLLYCDLAEGVKTDESVTKSSIIVRVAPGDEHKIGDKINVLFRDELLQVFDNKTEKAVMPYYPTYSKVEAEVKGDKIVLLGHEVKRPSAYQGVKDGKHIMTIPNDSVIDGDEISLKAYKCEMMEEGKYLVTLKGEGNDEYLFCTSPIPVEEGSSVKFGIAFEDCSFEDGVDLIPVSHQFEGIGHFIKRREKNAENGKKEVNFYAVIEKAEYKLSPDYVKRLVSIEGRKATEVDYRFCFTPKIVEDGTNLVAHQAQAILDYGKSKYVKVSVGAKEDYLDVTGCKLDDLLKVEFTIDQSKPLDVFDLSNGVKIM
jgi:multiple sugar transport system ATP-binding protein